MIETDHSAEASLCDYIVVHEGGACTGDDRHADAGKGLSDNVAGDRNVAQILAPACDNAKRRGILHHISGHRTVGLDIDADSSVVVWCGADRALRKEIADDVALHDREATALIEIAYGDAERCAIDRIVRDDRTFERKFRIERNL